MTELVKKYNKKDIVVDFHVHTCFSFDCKVSIVDVIKAAQRARLDAIAITDHDTLEGVEKAKKMALKENIGIIPGVEITTEDGTHLIGLFIDKLPKTKKMLDVIREIQAAGGLALLPHSFRSDTGLLYNWLNKKQFTREEIETILNSIDLIEIANHRSMIREEKMPLKLIHDYRLPFVAGSDAHYSFEIGNSRTEITGISAEEILKSQRQIFFYKKTMGIRTAPGFKISKTDFILQQYHLWSKIKKHLPFLVFTIAKYVGNQLIMLRARRQNNLILNSNNLFKIRESNSIIKIERAINR